MGPGSCRAPASVQPRHATSAYGGQRTKSFCVPTTTAPSRSTGSDVPWRPWRRPDGIATGRVIPSGDSRRVPSTKQDLVPRDFIGGRAFDVLYTGNMACSRSRVLALGGFDERLSSADDNDLCYRWLRAGYALRYEPGMVVWHSDWRTASALDRLAVEYARGQGAFYGKHLRRGDMRMLGFAARDLSAGLRGTMATWVRGSPNGFDWRRGVLRGLPPGLVKGLRLTASTGDRMDDDRVGRRGHTLPSAGGRSRHAEKPPPPSADSIRLPACAHTSCRPGGGA